MMSAAELNKANPYAKDVAIRQADLPGLIVKSQTIFKQPPPLKGVTLTRTVSSIRIREIKDSEMAPPADYQRKE